VFSAGCAFWLERLQPLFAVVAATALVYQSWLVLRLPPHRRTTTMRVVLWASILVSGVVLVTWIGLSVRYR
jgi:hypothetical protein